MYISIISPLFFVAVSIIVMLLPTLFLVMSVCVFHSANVCIQVFVICMYVGVSIYVQLCVHRCE